MYLKIKLIAQLSSTILRTPFENENRIPPWHSIALPSFDDRCPVHWTRNGAFFEGIHDELSAWLIHLSQKLIHVRRHETTAMPLVGSPQHFSGNWRKRRLVLTLSCFRTCPYFTFAVRGCGARATSAAATMLLWTTVDVSPWSKYTSYDYTLKKTNKT